MTEREMLKKAAEALRWCLSVMLLSGMVDDMEVGEIAAHTAVLTEIEKYLSLDSKEADRADA